MLTFGDAQGDDEENSLPHLDHGFHSKLPPGILPHGLPTVKEVAPAITPQEQKKEEEKKESKFQTSTVRLFFSKTNLPSPSPSQRTIRRTKTNVDSIRRISKIHG